MSRQEKNEMTIKTAGDLRGFLAEVLIDIKGGKLDSAQAGAISKVASQINQSLALEVGTALKLRQLEKRDLGDISLSLGDDPLPAIDAMVWCEQCDARVRVSEAEACKSPHCKAKVHDT